MTNIPKIPGTEEAWESGQLGRDEEFVGSNKDTTFFEGLDESLQLKAISIRMPTSMIDDLKAIANIRGLGYQPLMKQILSRFVESEKRLILREKAIEMRKRIEEEESINNDNSSEPKKACG